LYLQNAIYPLDYVKLRYVENHDTDRVMELAPTRQQALAWIAFQAFNKGAWLVYAGEESAASRKPDHFEKDVMPWENYELTTLIRQLSALKKDPAQMAGELYFLTSQPLLQAVWLAQPTSLAGIFNTSAVKGEIPTEFPDGTYQDLLSGEDFVIRDHKLNAPATACIFHCVLSNFKPSRKLLLV